MNEHIQGSEEWLKLRDDKIGSSDAPVIMEASPWKTPYQLWEDKILGRRSKPTAVMQRGLDLEQRARDLFSDMTGFLVEPAVVVHDKHEWMMASLDAREITGKYIAEIKCPGREDHEIAKSGKVPDKYYPQLQHQIEVCKLDKAYYFSFDGNEGILVEVNRDQKYIIKLIEKEKVFWEQLQNLTPPQLGDKDFKVMDNDIWDTYASQWITLNTQLKELEKREQELRERLISMSRNQNCKGKGVKVAKILKKGNIDYSKIAVLQGMDLEVYRKEPVEYWKISKE